MKVTYLFTCLFILSIASCKKDSTPAAQPAVFSFDFEGVHHSFSLQQLQLQVIDTGSAKGRYLSFNTGNSALPQVQFTIIDRSAGFYSANCFSTGPYPSLAGNIACHDSIPSNFCVGFFMQYVDTALGRVGLYARNDSVSILNLTSCTGGGSAPAIINATFNCVLTDSTGFISPKLVTNGQLSNITYIHK